MNLTRLEWSQRGYDVKPNASPAGMNAEGYLLYSLAQVINRRDIYVRPQRWEM